MMTLSSSPLWKTSRVGLILASGLLLASSALAAIPVPDGPEFQVNSYTTNSQDSPDAEMDDEGNFVIVWNSYPQDESNSGVFGQRYASDGSPLGGEFQVNTYTTSYQYAPSVAVAPDGDFVVVWGSDGDGDYRGVFGQRYASDGTPLGGEFQVNSYTSSYQGAPSVAIDDSGAFVVVWDSVSQDGDDYGVFGQRFASDGTPQGSEFQVNSYTTDVQNYPVVARDASGDFVVAWQSYQDGSYSGVFAQRFGSDGAPQGTEFQVNSYTTDYQRHPDVAIGGGEFVIVWNGGSSQDGSTYGVFGQRFAWDGTLLGGEFQANTYTTGDQYDAAVSLNGDGYFLVSWDSPQDGDFSGIYAQLYDSTGSPHEGEFQVNSYTTDFQGEPVIGASEDGHFVVAWRSYGQDGSAYGVFAQRLAPTGACCADGGCSLETELDCGTMNGFYNGDGTSCDDECQKAKYGDFTGDGTAEIFVWRPSSGQFFWHTSESDFADLESVPLGSDAAGDIALFGDMDGDGIEDPVVWRSSTGRWYWKASGSGHALVIGPRWGSCALGDTPLVGDMDGDNRSDVVVWRTGAGATQGVFYWLESGNDFLTAEFQFMRWGSVAFGDRPFVWDMDGDGKADPTVWRQCDGFWYWKASATGYETAGKQWGDPGDVPMLADMDGDSVGDLIVWQPDGEFLWTTSGTAFTDFNLKKWGVPSSGDVPLALDLDGDMEGDLVVWRRPLTRWYWTTSSTGFSDLNHKALGTSTDEIPDHREREANTGSTSDDWAPTCGGVGPSC